MEKNKPSQQEIAESFSNGDFKFCYPFLSESVQWNVVGDQSFDGKEAVQEQCERTAEYFKTVQTEFKTVDIMTSQDKVVIRGTGEFLRDGKRLSLICACDVYEFNAKGELESISSYCIPEVE